MKHLGILLSGRGSNFEAIARNVQAGKIPASIAVVISNREEALGLARAREMGLNARFISSKGKDREAYDREVVAALKEFPAVRIEPSECSFLVRPHKPTVAGNIRRKNGSEPPLHALFGHVERPT